MRISRGEIDRNLKLIFYFYNIFDFKTLFFGKNQFSYQFFFSIYDANEYSNLFLYKTDLRYYNLLNVV